MKLILAIVNSDDSQKVIRGLTQDGFSVTKLATTGGFLMSGNSTLIAGVEDSEVDKAIAIISKASRSRKQEIPNVSQPSFDGFVPLTLPNEVTVGGATVFVLDVDRFLKL